MERLVGFMCAFSRMIIILVRSFLVFPCMHLSTFIYICIHLVLHTFAYRPTFSINHCGSNLFIDLVLHSSGHFLSQMTPDISRHQFHEVIILFVNHSRIPLLLVWLICNLILAISGPRVLGSIHAYVQLVFFQHSSPFLYLFFHFYT